MFRLDQEISGNMQELSGQKRTHLQTLIEEETVGEDTFVWSLLDLMTLLLIFFLFVYTQSTGQMDPSRIGPYLQNQGRVSQIKETLPEKPSADTPIVRQGIPPMSGSVNISGPIDEEFSSAEPISAQAEWLDNQQRIEGTDETIEQIRQDALKTMEREGQVFSLRWNRHRLSFVLGERVTFPTGQAELLESFQPTLKRIALLIASKKGYMVVVSGHTDNTPINTIQFPSNWELSAARAISVAKTLTENGVDPARVSIQGNADYRPLYENTTPANRQANRRVEITLTKEKS